MKRHVYGPVPSRRLGKSLGVDLVPLKTCTFNCVYCQLGPTPSTTLRRAEYVDPAEVLDQVRTALSEGPRPDYITLAGSGEPTLNSAFGDVARGIRALTDIPITLLTNGALLYLPEVREACRDVDVVIPDLDAGDERTFQLVNRPHPGLSLARIVDGLAALREEFPGQIWLEVFLVSGLNDSDEAIEALKPHIERIRPDRIDLNTAVRPSGAEPVRPVSRERLEQVRAALGPRARIIADAGPAASGTTSRATLESVFELLQRRPCTLEDIASGLAIHRNEALKYVQQLSSEGKVAAAREGGRVFYRAS